MNGERLSTAGLGGATGRRIAMLGVLVLLVLAGCSSHRQSTSSAGWKTPAASTAIAPFGSERAASVAAALSSNTEAVVRSVVALPLGQALPASFLSDLSTLRVAFDPSTYVAGPDGTGTVEANVGTGGAMRRWRVGLVLQDGVWKLSGSMLASR